MKGGCSKYMSEQVGTTKTKFEEEALVKDWKDTFNYKRKVKKDVQIANYCKTMISASPAKTDADFKETKCKTVEKAKKQCAKSLKATCNFVRGTVKKLHKKAQKGTRKVKKLEGFTALNDPLKTKIKEFKCEKVKADALTAAMFDKINAHYDSAYGQIKTLKETGEALVTANKEAKEAHKKALKDAKTAKQTCEDAAEKTEKDAIAAAKVVKDAAITAADALTDNAAKKTAKKAAETIYKAAVKVAKEAEEVADEACDTVYDASKKTAKDTLKAAR